MKLFLHVLRLQRSLSRFYQSFGVLSIDFQKFIYFVGFKLNYMLYGTATRQ